MRRLQKEALHAVLPVGGVRAEVGKVAGVMRGRRHRLMGGRIDRTIERQRGARAEAGAKLVERLAARETEDEIESAQAIRRQILLSGAGRIPRRRRQNS